MKWLADFPQNTKKDSPANQSSQCIEYLIPREPEIEIVNHYNVLKDLSLFSCILNKL